MEKVTVCGPGTNQLLEGHRGLAFIPLRLKLACVSVPRNVVKRWKLSMTEWAWQMLWEDVNECV